MRCTGCPRSCLHEDCMIQAANAEILKQSSQAWLLATKGKRQDLRCEHGCLGRAPSCSSWRAI